MRRVLRSLFAAALLAAVKAGIPNATVYFQPDNKEELLRVQRFEDGSTVLVFARKTLRDKVVHRNENSILDEYRDAGFDYEYETSSVIYVVDDDYKIVRQGILYDVKLSRDGPPMFYDGGPTLLLPDSKLKAYLMGDGNYLPLLLVYALESNANAFDEGREWVRRGESIVSVDRRTNATVSLGPDGSVVGYTQPSPLANGYYGENFALSVAGTVLRLTVDGADSDFYVDDLPRFSSTDKRICGARRVGSAYHVLFSKETDELGVSTGQYMGVIRDGAFRAIERSAASFSTSATGSTGVVDSTCGDWTWIDDECNTLRNSDGSSLVCGTTEHLRAAGEVSAIYGANAAVQLVEVNAGNITLHPQMTVIPLDEPFEDVFLVMGGRALSSRSGAVDRVFFAEPEYGFSADRKYTKYTLLSEILTDVVTGHEIPSFAVKTAPSVEICRDICTGESAWCAGFIFRNDVCELLTDRARLGVDDMRAFLEEQAIDGESWRFSDYSGLCLTRTSCEHSRVEHLAVGGDGSQSVYLALSPVFQGEYTGDPVSLHPNVEVTASDGIVWQILSPVSRDTCFAHCEKLTELCVGAEYLSGTCKIMSAQSTFLMNSGYPVDATEVAADGSFDFSHAERGTMRMSTSSSVPWSGTGTKQVDLTDGLGEFLFQRDVLYTRMNCDRSTTNPLRAESHCAYRGTLQYSHANRVVRRLVGSASVCSQLCDLNMAWCLATYTEGADCFLLSTAQLVEDNPERLEDEIRTKESEAFSRCDPQVICSLASPFNLVGSVGTVTINGYVAVNSCASRMVASLGSCASEPRSRTWGLTRTQCRSSCCATEDCTAAEYGESAHGTRYCDLIGVGGSAAALSNMDAVVCYDSAGDPRRDPITGYYALDGDALLGTGHAPAKHLRDLPVSSLEVCAELADEAYPSPSLGFLLDGEDCYLFPAEDYPAAEGFTEVSAGDGAPRSNFLVRDPAASNAPDKFVYSRLPGDLPVVEDDFLTLQGACTDEVGLYVLRVELLREPETSCKAICRTVPGCRGFELSDGCEVFVNWDSYRAAYGETGVYATERFFAGFRLEKHCPVSECSDQVNDASAAAGEGVSGGCRRYKPYTAPAEEDALSTLTIGLIGGGSALLLLCCLVAATGSDADKPYNRV